MTSWSVGQMLYHQATGDLVTDPREGAGGGGLAGPSLFLDQTEARRSENFFRDRLPPPSYLRVWMTAPPRLLGAEETRARFM